MNTKATTQDITLASLNHCLLRVLLLLGEAGAPQRDQACRIAAAAWSELRHTYPREAERLNGVLHALTQSTPTSITTLGDIRATR